VVNGLCDNYFLIFYKIGICFCWCRITTYYTY